MIAIISWRIDGAQELSISEALVVGLAVPGIEVDVSNLLMPRTRLHPEVLPPEPWRQREPPRHLPGVLHKPGSVRVPDMPRPLRRQHTTIHRITGLKPVGEKVERDQNIVYPAIHEALNIKVWRPVRLIQGRYHGVAIMDKIPAKLEMVASVNPADSLMG